MRKIASLLSLIMLLPVLLQAADNPRVVSHTANLLDSGLSVNLQWLSRNPVIQIRVIAGGAQKDVKIDPYDNVRNPDGYSGEITVTVPAQRTIGQPTLPFSIQLEDDLHLKSDLAGGVVPIPVAAQAGVVTPQQDSWGSQHVNRHHGDGHQGMQPAGKGDIVDKLLAVADRFDTPPSLDNITVNRIETESVTFSSKANDDKGLREIVFRVYDSQGNKVQEQTLNNLGRIWQGSTQPVKLYGGSYRVVAQAFDSKGNTSPEKSATFSMSGPAAPAQPAAAASSTPATTADTTVTATTTTTTTSTDSSTTTDAASTDAAAVAAAAAASTVTATTAPVTTGYSLFDNTGQQSMPATTMQQPVMTMPVQQTPLPATPTMTAPVMQTPAMTPTGMPAAAVPTDPALMQQGQIPSAAPAVPGTPGMPVDPAQLQPGMTPVPSAPVPGVTPPPLPTDPGMQQLPPPAAVPDPAATAAQPAAAGSGSIRVVILPAEVVKEGARWRLQGKTEWSDKETEGALPAGKHVLELKDVSGYKTPASRPVEIRERDTAEMMIIYFKN